MHDDSNSNGEPTRHPSGSVLKLLDNETALKRLDGDEHLFWELVVFFREDSRPLVDQIRTGLESGHLAQATYAAHSLKGLSANIGANAVMEAAGELETASRTENVAGARELLPRLEHVLAELFAAFDA